MWQLPVPAPQEIQETGGWGQGDETQALGPGCAPCTQPMVFLSSTFLIYNMGLWEPVSTSRGRTQCVHTHAS